MPTPPPINATRSASGFPVDHTQEPALPAFAGESVKTDTATQLNIDIRRRTSSANPAPRRDSVDSGTGKPILHDGTHMRLRGGAGEGQGLEAPVPEERSDPGNFLNMVGGIIREASERGVTMNHAEATNRARRRFNDQRRTMNPGQAQATQQLWPPFQTQRYPFEPFQQAMQHPGQGQTGYPQQWPAAGPQLYQQTPPGQPTYAGQPIAVSQTSAYPATAQPPQQTYYFQQPPQQPTQQQMPSQAYPFASSGPFQQPQQNLQQQTPMFAGQPITVPALNPQYGPGTAPPLTSAQHPQQPAHAPFQQQMQHPGQSQTGYPQQWPAAGPQLYQQTPPGQPTYAGQQPQQPAHAQFNNQQIAQVNNPQQPQFQPTQQDLEAETKAAYEVMYPHVYQELQNRTRDRLSALSRETTIVALELYDRFRNYYAVSRILGDLISHNAIRRWVERREAGVIIEPIERNNSAILAPNPTREQKLAYLKDRYRSAFREIENYRSVRASYSHLVFSSDDVVPMLREALMLYNNASDVAKDTGISTSAISRMKSRGEI